MNFPNKERMQVTWQKYQLYPVGLWGNCSKDLTEHLADFKWEFREQVAKAKVPRTWASPTLWTPPRETGSWLHHGASRAEGGPSDDGGDVSSFPIPSHTNSPTGGAFSVIKTQPQSFSGLRKLASDLQRGLWCLSLQFTIKPATLCLIVSCSSWWFYHRYTYPWTKRF